MIKIMIKNSSCKEPSILVRFEWDLSFVDKFWENNRMQNFMNINSVRAELFHEARRTDRHDETNSHFSQ